MAARWGASPEEWTHWSDRLGLQADLLPCVSNPHAKISEQSKLKALGKTPSRYNKAGEAVGIPEWTAAQSTERQVSSWSAQPDYGICLQTRSVRAIDIDIDDPVVAQRVVDLVTLSWGDLPRRTRAGSGKTLLLVRCTAPLTKRILRCEHGLVELLADGQQCLVAGTHSAGQRYEWPDGLPAEVPDVSLAELDALWAGIAAALGAEGSVLRNGLVPVAPRLLSDAWGDPTVAWLQENDQVVEWDRDGRVHVKCPWAHEHTSDSGPSATTYFPAGVGGFQQGHWRCLHAHCAHRTDADFEHALGIVASEFEVIEAPAPVVTTGAAGSAAALDAQWAERPWPAVERKKGGGIVASLQSMVALLARPDIVGLQVAYDEFLAAVVVRDGPGAGWRPLTDNDYTTLRLALEKRGMEAPGKENTRDSVVAVAERQRFDSAIEWASGLAHDGLCRVDTFLSDYYGVADTPYHRAVSRYLWTALAGRALVPGIKADMVPVLISGQGTGKTSSVECMAPRADTFIEINLEERDKDVARLMRGKMVGEIAELRGLAGRQAEAIRAWVSRRVEEWVPKFREFGTVLPRRLLLIGTGNNREFLDDDTGERRWLPVEVGRVDVAGVAAARDQLWAEGVALFQAGGVAWQDAQRLAAGVHADFKVQDEWTPRVAAWLALDDLDGTDGRPRSSRGIAVSEVLTSCLGLNVKEIALPHQRRVGKCLRALNYEKRKVRAGGANVWLWFAASVPVQIVERNAHSGTDFS